MKLSQVDWKTVAKAVWAEYSKDDIPGLASEMAYHFMFAIFPLLIFFAALSGFIGEVIGHGDLFAQIMSALYQVMPGATAEALRQPLAEILVQKHGFALIVGAVLALWSAANGVATIMKAFNRAYGVEETRSFIAQKLLALGLTVVLSLLVIVGFVLLLAGGYIEQWIAAHLGLGPIFDVLWTILRIAGVVGGISLALALLYWKGPNVKQEFQWITPGSVFGSVTWIAATVAFGVYVQFLGASSYSKTYGTISGLILFLLYLWLSSLVILLGAELNAETAKRYSTGTIRDKMTDPRKQLPGKQPVPHPEAATAAGVSPRDVAASNARSAAKLAAGGGSAATATMASRASGPDQSSATTGYRANGAAAGAVPPPSNGSGPGVRADARMEQKRTALTTFAVAAAAVAASLAIGLTHRNDRR